MYVVENGFDKRLDEQIKRTADRHLGEPWNANVQINDDGSYSIIINQLLGDEFEPRNLDIAEVDEKNVNWRKQIYWDWKSDTAHLKLLYKSDTDEQPSYENLGTIDVSDIQGTIDSLGTRETAIETSENIEVDYSTRKGQERTFMNSSKSDKNRSVSQKSDEAREAFPTDEVSSRFSRAYRVWNSYLSDVFNSPI